MTPILKASLICLAVATLGCMPLKQQDNIAKSHDDFYALYVGGYTLIGFGGELSEMNYEVIDEESNVTGPNNKIYSVSHRQHPFDVERGSPRPRIQIRIKTSIGRTIHFWGNGLWKLSIVAKDRNGDRETFEHEFKIWTFYYSPFFHGAPN